MENVFIYFLKMILTSAVMYAYYVLFLKDKTFHHYNRFYLIFLMVMSLILPLLKVSYFTLDVDDRIRKILNPMEYYTGGNSSYQWMYILGSSILGVVSVLCITRVGWGVLKIQRLRRSYPKQYFKGISFYKTALENAPFSFFKNLFWKDSLSLDSDLGRQILKHEMVHIEQKHSYDKVALELVQSIFWFNPVFYWVKKELNLIHEYLADNKAVKNKDTKAFAQMLIETHFSAEVIPMTHPFINSHLKKRLKMLQQSKTRYAYLRKLAVLPIVFCTSFVLLVNAKNKEIKQVNKTVHVILEDLKEDTIRKNTIQYSYNVDTHFEELSDSDSLKLKKGYFDLLKDAQSNDIFMINERKVSKRDLEAFIEKNYNKKNLSFSYTTSGKSPSYKVSISENSKKINQSKKDIEPINVDIFLSNVEDEKRYEENTLYYVEDKPATKKDFDAFVKEHEGEKDFEFFRFDKKGKGKLYSVVKNKKGDSPNKERHTNFMKEIKENIKKHNNKSPYIDVVASMEDKSTIVLENDKVFGYTDKGDVGRVKMSAEKINRIKKELDSLKKNKSPWVVSLKAVGIKDSLVKVKNKKLVRSVYLDHHGEQEMIAIQNENIIPPISKDHITYYVNGKLVSEKEFTKLNGEKIQRVNVVKSKTSKNHQIEIFTK